MAVDAYAYPSALSHYQRLTSGTAGYEKIIRTVQYLSHFLAWYLDHTGYPQDTIEFHTAIKKNCGGIRKALRLTKFVDHFKLAAIASNVKTSERAPRSLAVGRQLGYALFILLDNMTYLDSNAIKTFAAAGTVLEMAYCAWLSALVCAVISSLYALKNGLPAVKKDEVDKDRELAVQARRTAKNATQLQLISDLCDCIVVTKILGFLSLSDGWVGAAGTCSSLIGLRAAWKGTA